VCQSLDGPALLADAADGVAPGQQRSPESLFVVEIAGKAEGHADDGDRIRSSRPAPLPQKLNSDYPD
jgi:hypothetical protein